MISRKLIWILLFLCLLTFWELAYYEELLNPKYFSHPVGIAEAFSNYEVRRGLFRVMFVQILISSLVGGGLGIIFGLISSQSSTVCQFTRCFLRIAQWLPFFIFWPLPIWPPREGYRYGPIVWILIASVLAVSLTACHTYLAERSTLGSTWRVARLQVVRSAVLQALFISLISQTWLGEYGWLVYFLQSTGIAVGYAALIFLVAILFVTNSAFQATFAQSAEAGAAIIKKEINSENRYSLVGVLVLSALSILVWHVAASLTGAYILISSPVEVLEASYHLFIKGTVMPPINTGIWKHAMVSAAIVLGGLTLAGCLAHGVFKVALKNPRFTTRLFAVFPLTHVVVALFPLFLFHWIGLVGSWQATLQVAFLSFLPFLQILWGLRDRPLFCRILLAADNALPFALVGMTFGGILGSVSGLPFFMAVSRTYLRVAEGLSASLAIVLLLVTLSSCFRWISKYLYFEAGGGQAELTRIPRTVN